MKVFAIPTSVAGLTAGMSVLFFIGFSKAFGDDLLGHVILVQSAAAMISVAFVPQCWVYLIGARSRTELLDRYRCSLTAEVVGIALGAVVVAVAISLPLDVLSRWREGGLVIYASLAIQASSSCLGWLRATESWFRYSLWNLGPNLIRVPMIWGTPWAVTHGWLPDARGDQTMALALYFLAPDLLRLLTIHLPIVISTWRWPGFNQTVASVKVIVQNWFFDIGSAITDIADKVVVGALMGPQTLVAYFFARKLGIIATMVTEPFYAEQYRRIVMIAAPLQRGLMQRRVYALGIAFAIALFGLMIVGLFAVSLLPSLAPMVPTAITSLYAMFAGILLFDCLLSANKWSRYVAQLNSGNVILLNVRVCLFAMFALNAWLLNWMSAGLGVLVAFAISWVFEVGFITLMLRQARNVATRTEAHNYKDM